MNANLYYMRYDRLNSGWVRAYTREFTVMSCYLDVVNNIIIMELIGDLGVILLKADFVA